MRTSLPLATLLIFGGLMGQTTPRDDSFDVASVKPAAHSAAHFTDRAAMNEDGAQVAYSNVSLIVLVMRAYRVKFRQIVGRNGSARNITTWSRNCPTAPPRSRFRGCFRPCWPIASIWSPT